MKSLLWKLTAAGYVGSHILQGIYCRFPASEKINAHQRSVGAGRHVTELLSQLVQFLHGHLGAGLGQGVTGCCGGRRVC